MLARHFHRSHHIIRMTGQYHADWLDLINTGIGAVQHTTEGVEAYLTGNALLQVLQ
jgi:hypothetical protein